jgi:hypothetical protein
MKIREAHEHVNIQAAGGYRQWLRKLIALRWDTNGNAKIKWDEPQDETRAFVIRSNWVVECPHCNNACLAEPDALFACPDCLMQGNDHKPCRIVMPDARTQIEEILIKRPDPMTRNWLLSETVDDLRAENVEHGIGG